MSPLGYHRAFDFVIRPPHASGGMSQMSPLLSPIVVSRCDRIGDLILSLPTLSYLGQAGFKHRILHCAPYASDVGRWAKFNGLCEELWVDGEVEPVVAGDPLGLCLQLSSRSVEAFKKLKLKKTLGPRTKLWALWALKKSISQHRSRVKKSEMAYNIDLAGALLEWQNINRPDFAGIPALRIPPKWESPRSSPDWVLVVSNRGSAQDWPLESYLAFAEEKKAQGRSVDLLVSGNDAAPKLEILDKKNLQGIGIVPAFSKLSELIAYLAGAKNVLSSSTGPLHIAHAAGVPVTGIYPKTKLQSFSRWRPDGYWHSAPLRFIEIQE